MLHKNIVMKKTVYNNRNNVILHLRIENNKMS